MGFLSATLGPCSPPSSHSQGPSKGLFVRCVSGKQLDWYCVPSALGLWTHSGRVWTVSRSGLTRAAYSRRPCFWMGATVTSKFACISFCVTYYCTRGANDRRMVPLGLVKLLSIAPNETNKSLWSRSIMNLFFFFCSDLSRVPDKAVPMTIAPGNAAWTEHKL